MGFLSPLLLTAALAVAVPLILHLFHRQETQRLPFPAIRYLRRATREHARTIRLRQLLLLVLRMAAVALLATIAARPFLEGRGGSHDPTAVAIVLDNSMSSGLVQEDRTALDRLHALALSTLDEATAEDRVWVIRVGEPWDVAVPGTLDEARVRVRETEVSLAAGNLVDALGRASELVTSADLAGAEIHLLSDLQRTALPGSSELGLPPSVPVITYVRPGPDAGNRYLDQLLVGGGLPPLERQRTAVTVSLVASPTARSAADTMAVRLILNGQVRAAANAGLGTAALLHVGPFPQGRVSGYVEIDADELRADDRRYFSFRVLPPRRIHISGSRPFFLGHALDALVEEGRAEEVGTLVRAQMVLAVGGAGLASRPGGVPTVVIPSEDPTELPGLNRRLVAGGIPWRYEAETEAGETRLLPSPLPMDPAAVRIVQAYRLSPTDGASAAGGAIRARLETGDPWLVHVDAPGGPVLLVASPLEASATNLPLTAHMIPLLEWMTTRWMAPPGLGGGAIAGQALVAPVGATDVIDPMGTLHALDGTGRLRFSRDPGIYRFVQGDSVIEEVAVNVPTAESRLDRILEDDLRSRIGDGFVPVERLEEWPRAVFSRRHGREIWRPLLLALLALLLIESWVAASGRLDVRSPF